MSFRRSVFPVVLAAAFAGACSDHTVSVAPVVEPTALSPAPLASQTLQCTASVTARTVSCADAAPSGTVSSDIIVGGQNVYVKLASSNLVYNSGSGSFTFDVTVQNLIAQAMGTTDGVNGDGTGVRVFFQSLPVATNGGTGTITVTNPTATNGTFTASNQTYYTYPAASLGADGILSQNEVSSAKSWAFNVPSTAPTFTFSVYVSANVASPTGYVSLSGTSSMISGASQQLTATVKSAVGNTLSGQTVTFGTSASSVATVASDGTVSAVGPGLATITATSGTRTGSTTINVCPNLAVGSFYTYTGTAAASLCLAGSTGGEEYVVIPYNGDNSASVTLGVSGTNLTAISGTPSPSIVPQTSLNVSSLFQATRDYSFENKLRQQELALSQQLGRPAPGASRSRIPGASYAITSGVPAVGSTMQINMLTDGCAGTVTTRTATVKSVGTHIIIMEDNTNPANQLLTSEYDALAATFDTLAYPAVTAAYGTPNDMDANGRVIAVFTAAVNDLTPTPSSSYVGGYFYSRDLYTTSVCPRSNAGELFYMLAVDSLGTHGNVRSSTLIKSQSVATLGHEFQHLINASRRNAGGWALESTWLNEGLSHIAEEKIYYASSKKTSSSNLGISDIVVSGSYTQAYYDYGSQNISRLYSWLTAPDTYSPTQSASGGTVATRGSIWAFLRYALDRKGGTENTILNSLAANTDTGRTNVTNRLGTSMDTWLKDFMVTMYADDASIGAASTYLNPSWNFRSIYSNLNYGSGFIYPLKVTSPTSGATTSLTLAQNGVGYVRMGVAASAFSTVTVAQSGGGSLPTNLSVMVLRRK